MAGVGAASLPPGLQLGLAGAGMALLGLPHGASDLQLITPARRPAFVATYLAAVGLVVLLWLATPVFALAALLSLSAIHFATDRPADRDPAASWSLGVLLVAGPAVLHRNDLTELFQSMTEASRAAADLAAGLCGSGLIALLLLAIRVAVHRYRPDPASLFGIAALLFLPPLVGFTLGFILLHAWPQLIERQNELRCRSLSAYARLTAPVMVGAAAVLVAMALLFRTLPSAPATLLFAAIAALATPHMLVTPLWRTGTTSRLPVRA